MLSPPSLSGKGAGGLGSMPVQKKIPVSHSADVAVCRRAAKAMALDVGFDDRSGEEMVLVAGELAANLIRHAMGGTLTFTPLCENGRAGVQIEALDSGPGIPDVDRAMADGFSTAGSLGYGLGTVNRLMDELDIRSTRAGVRGASVVCKRWIRRPANGASACPLSFGAATRPHPKMGVNGDAFVIRKWDAGALVGVIDGLGHGQFAQRAAQKAREYVEGHYDRPLPDIFRGAGHSCRATRGVVMALARFDWALERLTFASIGNIEARLIGGREPFKFNVRRGIVGMNAPHPVVTENRWTRGSMMVLHSDGLRTHWQWQDFSDVADKSATEIAQALLCRLAKDSDDATVVVAKDRTS